MSKQLVYLKLEDHKVETIGRFYKSFAIMLDGNPRNSYILPEYILYDSTISELVGLHPGGNRIPKFLSILTRPKFKRSIGVLSPGDGYGDYLNETAPIFDIYLHDFPDYYILGDLNPDTFSQNAVLLIRRDVIDDPKLKFEKADGMYRNANVRYSIVYNNCIAHSTTAEKIFNMAEKYDLKGLILKLL